MLALSAAARIDTPAGVSWLGHGEQARFAGLGSGRRKDDFLAGRWLARELLGRWLGLAPARAVVEIDALGRTSVPGRPDLHLSISHSGTWIGCILARAPIGLDIERASRTRSDLPSLAAMVHGRAQCEMLAEIDDPALRLQRFYQLWTLKEAALKREGQGLDFARMRAMEFVPDVAGDALSLVHDEAGLVLALVGDAAEMKTPTLPAGVRIVERLRLVEADSTQSTPKSK